MSVLRYLHLLVIGSTTCRVLLLVDQGLYRMISEGVFQTPAAL